MNSVFISYRHESVEHAALVRRLGDQLRAANLQVELDQFFLEKNPGGPDSGGWPRWCEERAEQAACVLIVCSQGWADAYWGRGNPLKGCGAASEASVFSQQIYEDKVFNARIRLVILDGFDKQKMPARLRSWHHFTPFNDPASSEGLMRWVSQRLSMPNTASKARRIVCLAECMTDKIREHTNLQEFLEDQGWDVLPKGKYPHNDRSVLLEADLKDAVALVQIMETYPRENHFDHEQGIIASKQGKPIFYFRDDSIKLSDVADAGHAAFLSQKDVIGGGFEDFKQHIQAELEMIWQSKISAHSPSGGVRKFLIRVAVRSPQYFELWDKVYNWIYKQPEFRPQLLAPEETFTDKRNSPEPCHGYLVVCDAHSMSASEFATRKDLDACSLIQYEIKDDSRLPPAGIVYWPPPDPIWSRLIMSPPPKLHEIPANAPAKLLEFFEDARRAAK